MKHITYDCNKEIKFKNGILLELSELEEIIFTDNYIVVRLTNGRTDIFPVSNIVYVSYLPKENENL